eukprot:m.39876 g.39876  ORF g.39876 m.39876 type:complete len:53 (+) comp8018_c0_seq1:34-192(+)
MSLSTSTSMSRFSFGPLCMESFAHLDDRGTPRRLEDNLIPNLLQHCRDGSRE